jgi:hypothetical protein
MQTLYPPAFAAAGPLLLPLTVARLAGFLGHLLALTSVSLASFRFLYVYISGLVAEVAALFVWGDSLAAVVTVLIVAQSATLIGMMGFMVYRRRACTAVRV